MSDVTIETSEHIARITLNRLAKKNSLTVEMYAAIADAFAAAESDRQVRAIFIHGAPNCFTAGNDLKDFLERPPQGDDAPVMRFLRALSTSAKPIVAAVGGPAVGIGTTMLLHCDLVYAAPSARFSMPFVALGAVPEAASSLILPQLVGYQRAAELLLLGRPFDAAKAQAMGLVNEIVAEDQLIAHALDAARALAAQPPGALRLARSLLKRTQSKQVAERVVDEMQLFSECLASPESKEAMTAFFEKRKPDFSKF